MVLSKDQIKSAALKLEPAERESLAEELLLSLDNADREAMDAAWLAESRRRDTEFQSGKMGAKAVEELINRLERKAR